ncbi:MAG: N-acetyl sugar amidotransferase, partial [Rhodospirillales bacterium]|nr:N-acetyl sugar amidotransferase [Rhodospirillales bacterium]
MTGRNGPEAYYGLPQEVIYCNSCVMSNQRPASYPEFRHTRQRKTPSLNIWNDGVCDACRYNERKHEIDWEKRRRELIRLLDKYRRHDGGHDCI